MQANTRLLLNSKDLKRKSRSNMQHILKCPKCKLYTLKSICPLDKEKTILAIPLRYSEDETIAKIRREHGYKNQ